MSFKSVPNKTLEKVELQNDYVEKNKTKKTFAIMLNEGDGNYQESSSTTLPAEGYNLNLERSICIDNNDNKVEGAISINGNNKVTVTSNTSIYCTFYYDKILGNTALELLNQKPANLNTTLEGGLYRYQGTADAVTNNYICFGTSDKDTCISDTDKYMYRIIGINPEGQFKLIKKEALNTAYYWHNNYTSNTAWNASDLYKGLNGISGGTYNNLFIGNTTYIPSETWKNKIADTNWKYGDITGVNQPASDLYNDESGWSTTISAKIGLMYVHDYAYALKSGGENCKSNGEKCKTSWLYLWNSGNDSNPPHTSYEWTMSHYGWDSSGSRYGVWHVYSDGSLYIPYLNNTYSVRPIFFLESNTLISGDGTITSPYLITN